MFNDVKGKKSNVSHWRSEEQNSGAKVWLGAVMTALDWSSLVLLRHGKEVKGAVMVKRVLFLCVLVLAIAWHAFLLSQIRGGFAVGGEWIVYIGTVYVTVSSMVRRYINELQRHDI